MKKQIITDAAPGAIGPYSQAIAAGGFLFSSGQIPVDPKTNELVERNIEMQTRQVLENVKAVLAAANCTLEHVVKTTVFLKDMNDFAAVNTIYAEYFSSGILPARSAIEVARLPKDVLVEIEVIAKLT